MVNSSIRYLLIFVLLLVPAREAAAASIPWYHYHRDTLILHVWAASPAKGTIKWRAVGMNGRPFGRKGRQRVDFVKGANAIKLDLSSARRASGHRIEFSLDGRTIRLWSNRGAWSAGPPELDPLRRRRGVRLPYRYVGFADIQLARSFFTVVRAKGATKRLTLERSFGFARSYGIRPPAGSALVVVAKGTAGPVQLTLAQRTGKGLVFYDYFLVLDRSYRRYVIPFAAFRSRTPRRVPIRSIHSAAISPMAEHATAGTSISVGFFGLGRKGPRIARIGSTSGGVDVTLAGGGARRILRHAARKSPKPLAITEVVARGSRVRMPITAPRRLWLCSRYRAGVEQCDPPDAPHSHYLARPKSPDAPLVVDDFLTTGSVNAHRQPLTRFASGAATRRAMKLHRRPGLLHWAVDLPRVGAYAGFNSDLPPRMAEADSRRWKSVQVRVRGSVLPRHLELQLVDPRGRPAKVNLGQYISALGKEWQVVTVPMRALASSFKGYGGKGRLGRIARISIVASARRMPVKGTLELSWIRLSQKKVPAMVATFDSGNRQINALAGRIGKEAQGGASLALHWETPGHAGRALRVAISNVVPQKSYAILIFNLGGLPAFEYKRLVFWARGGTGALLPNVILAAGRRQRSKVETRRLATLSSDWTRIAIPLSAFKSRRPLRRFNQLIFAWEGRPVSQEAIELDTIQFE